MSTRFQIIQHADEGSPFAHNAFDGAIGKATTLKVEGRGVGETTLISAEVADDGKTARLTFETDDAGDLLNPPSTAGFSIRR